MAKMKIKECSLEILKDKHKAHTHSYVHADSINMVCVSVSIKVVLLGQRTFGRLALNSHNNHNTYLGLKLSVATWA